MAKSVFDSTSGNMDMTSSIVRSFVELGQLLRALLSAQAEEHGLSPLQLQIIIHLFDKKEGARQSDLAVIFQLSKPTISVALRSLLQKKLIRKNQQEEDRRMFLLELTERGTEVAKVARFYPEPVRKLVATIPAAEKKILFRNIKGITDRLGVPDNKG
jgi:DNA-binding MarR family transcriptional regulator